jgi:hypothetical protein
MIFFLDISYLLLSLNMWKFFRKWYRRRSVSRRQYTLCTGHDRFTLSSCFHCRAAHRPVHT